MARIARQRLAAVAVVVPILLVLRRECPEEAVRNDVAHAGAKTGVERLVEEGERLADRGVQFRAGREQGGERRRERVAGAEQFIDNVLASPQGAVTGEKFERFDVAFVGAGDTLAASLAALLASGQELHAAVGEALAFLDQALDAGFRPGMGNVIPDRFFWALAPEDDEEPGAEDGGETAPRDPRHVH